MQDLTNADQELVVAFSLVLARYQSMKSKYLFIEKTSRLPPKQNQQTQNWLHHLLKDCYYSIASLGLIFLRDIYRLCALKVLNES